MYSQASQITFICPMIFNYFPLDTQVKTNKKQNNKEGHKIGPYVPCEEGGLKRDQQKGTYFGGRGMNYDAI